MPRRYFHYVLIALLLLAQQGALVHAAWHAHRGHEHAAHALDANDNHDGHNSHDGYRGDDSHAHEYDHDHDVPAGQANLCAFDLAFGQVLGGVRGACAPLPALVSAAAPVAEVVHSRGSTESVPARSRGPPIGL